MCACACARVGGCVGALVRAWVCACARVAVRVRVRVLVLVLRLLMHTLKS